MKVKSGDRISIESEKVGHATRKGVIEKVLAQHPPRYQVRWEDGRTTVITPTTGAATIEKATRSR